MSISANGVSPEFAMVSQLYDTSSKLLGEGIQMGKKPTKVGATRIRKLLNQAGQNVKLARKDFTDFTMEKFGVEEDTNLVGLAKHEKPPQCPKCGLFLPREQEGSTVLVCSNCGSEPFESQEDVDAPTGDIIQA